jgi:hypothetical protein
VLLVVGGAGDRSTEEPGVEDEHVSARPRSASHRGTSRANSSTYHHLGLAEYHHGDRDDVRSIIHDLHEQSTSISDEERW